MVQKKDPFQKSVNNACKILAGWKNIFGNNENRYTEANDGIAFRTTGNEEKKQVEKEIACYKFGKMGHYSN